MRKTSSRTIDQLREFELSPSPSVGSSQPNFWIRSGGGESYMEPAARRLRISHKRLRARQGLAALQSGDGGLACAHAGSQLGLGQPRAHASPDQFGGNFEL